MNKKIEYIADLYIEANKWLILWSEEEAKKEVERINKQKGKMGVIWREKELWTVFEFNL
jgi:hypothetical protein